MSVIESMRGCHRSGCQTQPRLCVKIAAAAPPCPEAVLAQTPPPASRAILPLQRIHQVPEAGGQFGIFRAKVLLQPFTDGTADRSAGGAIDLLAALVDSVGHCGFRFALVSLD
jgi:hypothetical protein